MKWKDLNFRVYVNVRSGLFVILVWELEMVDFQSKRVNEISYLVYFEFDWEILFL